MLGRLVIMKKCHVVCIFDVKKKNTSEIKIISPVNIILFCFISPQFILQYRYMTKKSTHQMRNVYFVFKFRVA